MYLEASANTDVGTPAPAAVSLTLSRARDPTSRCVPDALVRLQGDPRLKANKRLFGLAVLGLFVCVALALATASGPSAAAILAGAAGATSADALGPSELGIWVAHKDWLDKNQAAVKDFLEDTLIATRWYLDPKNHDEAVKIASDFAQAPPALFSSWLFTQKDYYRDPKLQPNVKALQANVDTMKDLGFIKDRIDVTKYIDTSLLAEALKRVP